MLIGYVSPSFLSRQRAWVIFFLFGSFESDLRQGVSRALVGQEVGRNHVGGGKNIPRSDFTCGIRSFPCAPVSHETGQTENRRWSSERSDYSPILNLFSPIKKNKMKKKLPGATTKLINPPSQFHLILYIPVPFPLFTTKSPPARPTFPTETPLPPKIPT